MATAPPTASSDAAFKLGKLPARTDVRTLSLARYVEQSKLPQPPVTLDLATAVAEWPMYANDRIGDCTCAAAGHMIETWTAAAGGQAVEVSEQDVLTEFDRVKIVDPATGEEGAVVLDVLKDWRTNGVGGHTIGAFARIHTDDHALVRTGAALFGGVYIGLELPETAQVQTVWDWTHRLNGRAAPGSWGGHAVNVVRYDESTLTVVTWGGLQQLTWAFWDRYVDEAYAIISPDFIAGDATPDGIDLETLRRDLQLITG